MGQHASQRWPQKRAGTKIKLLDPQREQNHFGSHETHQKQSGFRGKNSPVPGLTSLVPKGCQVLLHQQVKRLDGFVLRGVGGALARFDTLDHVIRVDVVKERHGLSTARAASVKWRRHNSVQR